MSVTRVAQITRGFSYSSVEVDEYAAVARPCFSLQICLLCLRMNNQIIIRKNEEHRILAGHQWVFSNEIKTIQGNPEAGDVVELARYDGKFLGHGFYNPHSLIAFRLLGRDHLSITFEFLEERIRQEVRKVGFWKNQSMRELLTRTLVRDIDKASICRPGTERDLAQRLVALAKENHENLTR